MEAKLLSWLTKNEELTRKSCEILLRDLKKNHLDPVFEKLLGEERDKISFEDIIGGYQRVKDDFHQYAEGAEDVIAAVFLELHRVRNTKVVIHLTFNVIIKEVTEAYTYNRHHALPSYSNVNRNAPSRSLYLHFHTEKLSNI